MRFLGGWGDAGWLDDGRPLRFSTREAAQSEIDDFVSDCEIAVRAGYMEDGHKASEFRIVPA